MRRISGSLLVLLTFGAIAPAIATSTSASPNVKVGRIVSEASAELIVDGQKAMVQKGGRSGPWTLVEIVPASYGAGSEYAILEDYSKRDGHILFVNTGGVQIDLPKSSEPTITDSSKLYLGHTPDEIMNSARDLLGNQIL